MSLFRTQPTRSLVAPAVLVGAAIAGYMAIERWALLDATYITMDTL